MANENEKTFDFTQDAQAPDQAQPAVDPELVDKDFDTTGVTIHTD